LVENITRHHPFLLSLQYLKAPNTDQMEAKIIDKISVGFLDYQGLVKQYTVNTN
jgi:hypothetical protein